MGGLQCVNYTKHKNPDKLKPSVTYSWVLSDAWRVPLLAQKCDERFPNTPKGVLGVGCNYGDSQEFRYKWAGKWASWGCNEKCS